MIRQWPNRMTEERARTLRYSLELGPRATEAQAKLIASRINCRLPVSYGAVSRRYVVLNHYPSGQLRLALVRG